MNPVMKMETMLWRGKKSMSSQGEQKEEVEVSIRNQGQSFNHKWLSQLLAAGDKGSPMTVPLETRKEINKTVNRADAWYVYKSKAVPATNTGERLGIL